MPSGRPQNYTTLTDVTAEGHDDPNAPTRGCWSFQPFHGGEPIIVLGRDLKRVRNGKALG
jgi:hypothetical protein